MSNSPASIPPDARRITVPIARLTRWLDGYAANHEGFTATTLDDDVIRLDSADDAQAWISVPFPPLTPDASGPPLMHLLAHAQRTRRIGVLLVRRGGHAVGIFDGAHLVESKVDSSYVQGTTKAGGWSQKRYSRRRDNQSRAAFGAAADTAARIFNDPSSLDAVILGGDRLAVEAVLADARLQSLRPLITGALLDVSDPRLRVLRETPQLFLSVRIALFP